MHVLDICSIIFWRCCVTHPSEVCVYESSGCKEWKRCANLIISTSPPPPQPHPLKKLIVSGPYWLEILPSVIPKLTDASHKRKLFSYHNCAPLRLCIDKKAILVFSTYYSRSDVFAAKDGKNELLLLLWISLLSLLSLSLLCCILLNKFESLPLPSSKAATCTQYRAFLKFHTV